MKNKLIISLTLLFSLLIPQFSHASSTLNNANTEFEKIVYDYNSTAGAMAVYYSINKNLSVQSLLSNNSEKLSMLDSNFSNPEIKKQLLSLPSNLPIEDYKMILSNSNVGLNIEGNSTAQSLRNSLSEKKNSIDAYIINSGMLWAKSMSNLSLGSFNDPSFPVTPTTTNSGVENLAFGLFLNQTIANFVGNYPDIFKTVAETGVVSKNANTAWVSAMNAAGKNSNITISNVVKQDECGKSFLTGISSNSYSSCSPCFIVGSYSRSLIENSLTSKNNPINNMNSITEFDFLNQDTKVSENNLGSNLSSNTMDCKTNSNIVNDQVLSTIKNTVKNLK